MPWSQIYGHSQKKDQIIIALFGLPPTFNRENAKKCFHITHGVLPTGYSHEKDYSKCTWKKVPCYTGDCKTEIVTPELASTTTALVIYSI